MRGGRSSGPAASQARAVQEGPGRGSELSSLCPSLLQEDNTQYESFMMGVGPFINNTRTVACFPPTPPPHFALFSLLPKEDCESFTAEERKQTSEKRCQLWKELIVNEKGRSATGGTSHPHPMAEQVPRRTPTRRNLRLPRGLGGAPAHLPVHPFDCQSSKVPEL